MWDFIKSFGKIEEDCINLCFVIQCRSFHSLALSLYQPRFRSSLRPERDVTSDVRAKNEIKMTEKSRDKIIELRRCRPQSMSAACQLRSPVAVGATPNVVWLLLRLLGHFEKSLKLAKSTYYRPSRRNRPIIAHTQISAAFFSFRPVILNIADNRLTYPSWKILYNNS